MWHFHEGSKYKNHTTTELTEDGKWINEWTFILLLKYTF